MSIFSMYRIRAILSSPIVMAAVFSLCTPAISRAEETGYHIINKQHIDGDTKWDYLIVDGVNRHLFITHGDHVAVFDIDKKQIAGTIPDTHGVHGVALAADLDRGFTSNGKDNSVTIFSLSTLKVIGSASTEKKPDGIVYDPSTKRVFAANGESDSLTPIDATTGKALAAIPLGGKPEFVAVDGKGRLFVNLEDKNQVAVIDTQKLTVTHHYDLAANCDEPAGLSIDIATQRLFVGCHNQKMAIVDANTGNMMDTPAIGRGSDATAYDATAKLAFSSNGDGTLTVIGATDATHYRVKQIVSTMPTARTMAIDPISHTVYLVAAETEGTDVTKQKQDSRPRLKPNTLTLITVAR